ncbi:AimR family lysis-lysogeny pheromone receptor [Bacillus thuringiensis]|uniref:AimR family lysis-lysogeny pheromone receptor n=1 Tax=Bacillus thuringiensis TaxID=1428 RepID=A0AAW9GNB2_BACTU|nr:AimR family lysis-lysogeny pheromone receptor [Bacillus thuringiensis]MDY0854045.1 AimR family lysis-lysogeny pheromone receptor [Bacillus thuringiensis]MDY4394008.1 AimR family lysis-lysogeny pheromone receptor [Bacillus thuringiensis]
MKPLHVEICELIEKRPELTYVSVADAIGVSVQYMSKFKKNGTISFCGLLKLSKVLTLPHENFRTTMRNFCLKVNTTELIKQSFEYASITRDTKLLEKLIKKYRKDQGTIKEFVNVYGILHQYMIRQIDGESLIEKINTLRQPTDYCLKILLNIMKCYGYYFSKEFSMMIGLGKEVEKDLKQLSGGRKDFIQHCYFYKVYEVLAPVHLRSNNREMARKYASIIKNANISTKTVSDASYIMGMSYLLENKQKCLELIRESYEFAKEIGDKGYENEAFYNMKMVEMYYAVETDEVSNVLNNIDEYAQLFYQRENEDFIVLFRAMQDSSNESLHQCLQRFFTQGNYLFSSLSARELYKRGENSAIIEWMMDYKQEVGGKDLEKDNIEIFCDVDFNDNTVCCS